MENGSKVYIVREYLIVDDFGGVRIDEEAVFSSIQEAHCFLKSLVNETPTNEDLILFRIEILEYIFGDIESYIRKWTYTISGDLLDEFDSLKGSRETGSCTFTGKYRVGDIVFVAPRVMNRLSPSTNGTYGVVIDIPSAEVCKSIPGCKQDESNNDYIIYYITEYGYLDHFHMAESVLSELDSDLPNELEFLRIYSDWLKKDIQLPDDLIARIHDQKIMVKNIETFEFLNKIGVK